MSGTNCRNKSRIYRHFNFYILFFFIILFFSFKCNFSTSKLQSGDIVFQISPSSQSRAIQIATGSDYSHVGILFVMKETYYVFEGVQPVRYISFTEWIKNGERSHYVVKRLKDHKKHLNSSSVKKMISIGNNFLGKDYDFYFEWTDKRIYCSELVWKIYKRALDIEIGELKKLSEFNIDNPYVKNKLNERYGMKIPYNEPVISPGDIFDSDFLYTVKTFN